MVTNPGSVSTLYCETRSVQHSPGSSSSLVHIGALCRVEDSTLHDSGEAGVLYLVQVGEVNALPQSVELGLIGNRHLCSVLDVREGVWCFGPPTPRPRRGLWRDVVGQAAFRHGGELLPVLF